MCAAVHTFTLTNRRQLKECILTHGSSTVVRWAGRVFLATGGGKMCEIKSGGLGRGGGGVGGMERVREVGGGKYIVQENY